MTTTPKPPFETTFRKNQARLAALTSKQRVAEYDPDLGPWCVYDDGWGLVALAANLASATVKRVFAPADWSLADLKQFLRSDGRSN